MIDAALSSQRLRMPPPAALLVVGLASAALAFRPVSYSSLFSTALVGIAAALLARRFWGNGSRGAKLGALAMGAGAFGVVGFSAPGIVPSPPALGVAALVIAAVSEEALFRGLCYDSFERWGTLAAIIGSALLFAVIHIPIYGVWVLPVDFAAGILFGWQRQVTGGWGIPALTHAVANLLMIGG